MKRMLKLAASAVTALLLLPSSALAWSWTNGSEVWDFNVWENEDGELGAIITNYRQVDEYGTEKELPDNLNLAIPATVPIVWTNELGHLENVFDGDGNYVSNKFVTTYGPEVKNMTATVTAVDLYVSPQEKLASVSFPATVGWVRGVTACTNLVSVTVSDYTRFIGGAFIGSPWLKGKGEFVVRNGVLVAYQGTSTSVTVPDGVETIGDYAFSALYNDALEDLTSVTLPASVTAIGDSAFEYCGKLATINIPNNVTSIGYFAFDWCESLAAVVLPDDLDTLGYGAFCGTGLATIVIPESIESLEGGVFSDCTNLTSVTLPKGLKEIGDYAFDNCPALASIPLPDSVARIGDCAFNFCTSLASVALPDSLEMIGYSAFKNCGKLATVTGGENVKEVGSEAFDYTKLYDDVANGIVQAGTLVVGYTGTLPATLSIPDDATYIATCALENSDIVSLALPDSVHTIGSYAFYTCTNLTTVTGGDGVSRIFEYAFYGTPYLDTIRNNCDKTELEFGLVRLGDVILGYQGVCPASIEIPDGVTQICPFLFDTWEGYVTPSNILSVTIGSDVRWIGDNAFNGLENLATVTGGGAIEHVGAWAFAHCPKLTGVMFAGPLTWLEPNMFYQDFNLANVAFDLVEPEDDNEFSLETDFFKDSDKLASVTVTFDGYTLEGWEARCAGPAFEVFDDELPTYRLQYKSWWYDDWYPSLINYRPIWNGGASPEDDPSESEELAFGPGKGSRFFITEAEEAHVVGVYGLKWSDFVARSDGFRAFADDRVVDREKGSGAGADDHDACVTYSDMDALVWAGWTKYAGFTDEDAYADAWLNEGDAFNDAYMCAQTAGKDIYAGGYREEVPFDSSFAASLENAFANADRLMPMIVMFGDDYDWYGMVGAIGHAVVCCGYSLDTTKPLTDPTCLKGLFIIDPDNDRETNGGKANAPDTITYCPTVWDAANGQYEIQGIFGATGYIGEYAMSYTIRTPEAVTANWSEAEYVADPDPVQPEPVQPEPVQPEPVQPDSGQQQSGDQQQADSQQQSGGAPQQTDTTPTSSDPAPVAPGASLVAISHDMRSPTVAPASVAEVVESAASTYDGYLYDISGSLKGTIQVKVAKAKNGTAKVTASIQVIGAKKQSVKGELNVATGTVSSGNLTLKLDAAGMTGRYGTYEIDGMRSLFASKDAGDKTAAAAVLAKWQGVVNVAWAGGTLSVAVAAKGKTKVAGSLVDGTKVSAVCQLVVGGVWSIVPVVYAKGNATLSFALWLPTAGGEAEVAGLTVDAIAGKPGALKGGAKFHVDAAAFSALLGQSVLPYLPDGVSVTQGGVKWTLPKAGKVVYVKGSSKVDETKLGDNPSGLKLTYKAKDGTFKGSFKAYADVNGKPKATTVNVAGVLVNGIGHGTATIKKVGGVPVTVE